jgi:uncharacterized repeat protein (TIGR01451 family)
MTITNKGMIVAGLISLLLLSTTAARASQDTGPIQLTSMAEVENVTTDESGKQTVKRVPASKVVPGKDVIYTLVFENTGTLPGNDIVIQNPIPEHTVYKADTAGGTDTEISYSVDGGNNFASADALTVSGADGSTRQATASDYTTIRWKYTRPLPPGEKSSVEFRVVLR